MEKITLKMSRDDYPILLERYGLEGAKMQAIQMCLAQKVEVTETNLYSMLSNLEMDLEMENPMYTEEETV